MKAGPWWLGAGVAVVAFVSYWMTICRTIYWGDGIELTCVAAVLGVAHPTGYPLFALLGKVFAQLPLGTIAFRLNLMSAAAATLAAVLVAWTVWRLLPLLDLIERERTAARALLATGAGWTVAFSRTFWYQAGLTEVYLLNAAVFAGVIALVVRAVESRSSRWFLAACLLAALGLGNQMMAMVLIPGLAIVGVWLVRDRKEAVARRKGRRAVSAKPAEKRLARLVAAGLGLGVAGVAVYAYLPVRAASNPPFNWGDPSSVKNFLWSVRGGEFGRNYFFKVPADMFPDPRLWRPMPFDSRTYPRFLRRRLGEWLCWTGDQVVGLPAEQIALRGVVGLLTLGVAGIGWAAIARRQTVLALFLTVVVGLNMALVATYGIPDIEGYFFPIHLVVVIGLFVALGRLFVWTEENLLLRRSGALCAVFLLIPALAWVRGRAFCDHSEYRGAERYGREVLSRLAPDAMLLTAGDYDIAPLWYQQIVEKRRRDCVVFGRNFLATPGYHKFFEGRYDPPVVARYFEETPEGKEAFYEALNEGLIAPNLARRPVYTTWTDPDLAFATEPIEISALQDLEAMKAPERRYFPPPYLYRLHER